MINFKKEHFDEMCNLAMEMLLDNGTITNKLGTPLNIVELLHQQSINSLNGIKTSLDNHIRNLENQDEWIIDSKTQSKLEEAKARRQLVNLIIGWKRYNLELAENARKKEELTEKLAELKESQKTPEDRIKELEAQLKELEEF